MKKTILLIGLLLVGCSDLISRGTMTAKIDTQAQSAAELKPLAMMGELTPEKCDAEIIANAAKFDEYNAAKTTNFFKYAFGDKTIWVNPTYDDLIGRVTEAMHLAKTQATTRPASWKNATVAVQCSLLMRLKEAKDGTKR